MIKTIKKIVCIGAVLLAAPLAFSASQSHQAEVARVQVAANGNWIIFFKEQDPDCSNTNTPWKKHHITVGKNGVDEAGSEKMLSLALTAAASSKKATIYFDDSEPACYVNRLYVNF